MTFKASTINSNILRVVSYKFYRHYIGSTEDEVLSRIMHKQKVQKIVCNVASKLFFLGGGGFPLARNFGYR